MNGFGCHSNFYIVFLGKILFHCLVILSPLQCYIFGGLRRFGHVFVRVVGEFIFLLLIKGNVMNLCSISDILLWLLFFSRGKPGLGE